MYRCMCGFMKVFFFFFFFCVCVCVHAYVCLCLCVILLCGLCIILYFNKLMLRLLCFKRACYYYLIAIRSATRQEEENMYGSVEMNRQESRLRGDSITMEKNVAYESVDY